MARLASLKGFDCQTRSYRLGSGSYWVRLVPGPHMHGGMRNLSFIPGWQRNATLYLHHANAAVERIALDNRTLSRLTHIGAQVVVPARPRLDARRHAAADRRSGEHQRADLLPHPAHPARQPPR
jgi:hypothetical protein